MSDETTIHNTNPYDLIDHPHQDVHDTNSEKKESGVFIKKIIKSIAKMSGLPDPETGESIKDIKSSGELEENKTQINTETTLEQDVVAQEGETSKGLDGLELQQKKFSFEKVMDGVAGFLSKISKKEEKLLGENQQEQKNESLSNNSENTPEVEQSKTELEQQIEKNNEEYLNQ